MQGDYGVGPYGGENRSPRLILRIDKGTWVATVQMALDAEFGKRHVTNRDMTEEHGEELILGMINHMWRELKTAGDKHQTGVEQTPAERGVRVKIITFEQAEQENRTVRVGKIGGNQGASREQQQ